MSDLIRTGAEGLVCGCRATEVTTLPEKFRGVRVFTELIRRADCREHGAEACRRCGAPNPAWSAPSPLWNYVMRAGDIRLEGRFEDVVCIRCFVVLANEMGVAKHWRLTPVDVRVELGTTTASGRVWDDQAWLWIEPPTP